MSTGIIKRLVRDRGFGFIQSEDHSSELFFHSSAVESPTFDELEEGQSVEFESQPDPKDASRSRAVNVRKAGA